MTATKCETKILKVRSVQKIWKTRISKFRWDFHQRFFMKRPHQQKIHKLHRTHYADTESQKHRKKNEQDRERIQRCVRFCWTCSAICCHFFMDQGYVETEQGFTALALFHFWIDGRLHDNIKWTLECYSCLRILQNRTNFHDKSNVIFVASSK